MQYWVVDVIPYTVESSVFRLTGYSVCSKTCFLGAKKTPVHLKFRVYLRNLGLRLISPIEVVQ